MENDKNINELIICKYATVKSVSWKLMNKYYWSKNLIESVALDNEGLHHKENLLVDIVAVQWTIFQKHIFSKGYMQCIDCCVSNIVKMLHSNKNV